MKQVDQRTRLSIRSDLTGYVPDELPVVPTDVPPDFIQLSTGCALRCQEWVTGPARIGYVSGVSADTDTYLILGQTKPAVHLLFSLEGNVQYGPSSTSPLGVAHQHHTLLTVTSGAVEVRCPAGQPVSLILVRLDLVWLAGQVATGCPWVASTRNGLLDRGWSWLSPQPLSLTPRMLAVLHELVHGTLPTPYQSIYLNGKLMELLALQLNQHRQRMAVPVVGELTDGFREKMQRVRDLLLENLASAPSIRELARQVGTNEFSLKHAFKLVFNTTIFGYLQQARMEKARLMLAENETKIAEVAHSLGYKHATHFTAAFKKHFGFLPNKIRVALLVLLDYEFDFVCLLWP